MANPTAVVLIKTILVARYVIGLRTLAEVTRGGSIGAGLQREEICSLINLRRKLDDT